MALDPLRALLGTRLCQPGIEQASPHGFYVHPFAPIERGGSAWLAPALVLGWTVLCAVACRRWPQWRPLLWRAQHLLVLVAALALAVVAVKTRDLPEPSRYVASLPVTHRILPLLGKPSSDQLHQASFAVATFRIGAHCRPGSCFAWAERATESACGVGPILHDTPLVLRHSRDGRFAFFDGFSTRYASDPQPAQVAFRTSDLACVSLRDVDLPNETRPSHPLLGASVLLVLLSWGLSRARASAVALVLSALSGGLVFYLMLPWLAS